MTGSKVLVVGAGVVGLSCAVRLLEHGHRVDVLARDLPLETTSAVAAAFWYPYRAYPYERVAGWSAASYRAFEELAADPDTGVRLVPGTEYHREHMADPWWRDAVPALTRVRAAAPPYVDAWSFVAPVVEMPLYLPWLARRVDELGGTITRLPLTALPGHAEVVVDASGLGARLLASDPSVQPVRGQVVYVEPAPGRTVERWALDGAGPTYVIPRSRDVVVGGTDEEGEWSRTPDPDTTRLILERATALVPELAGARVLRHRVGLRPARPTVRLEAEEVGATRVVHCYGHGGAGVTLSWGCADEVAALVGDPVRA